MLYRMDVNQRTTERISSGGGLMRTRKLEPTGGGGVSRGMLPRENLKFKSSEMARDGSKNVTNEVDF